MSIKPSRVNSTIKAVKTGKIIPNGVRLEMHEYNTILFLTTLGKNIELIPPSHTPNTHNADFSMDGLIWESKSPVNCGKGTIEHCLKKAARQAENIVVDLRRTKMLDKRAITELEKHFRKSRRIKRLLIVTKNESLVDFKK